MSKWINAEKLLNRYREVQFRDGMTEGVVRWLIEHNLSVAPSIDIVRCGECELNETDDCPMVYYTPLEDGGFETRWWNRPDDFCSWGERRK